MRAKSFVIWAALASGVAMGFGCAGHQKTDTQQYNYLTGSYLPQDVERNGPVTNGKNNVRVVDQNDLDKSGGANVTQSLRQLGVTSTSTRP
jgi:hypothetical protein